MQIIFILLLCFSLLVATVAVQNTTPVTVKLLFWQWADVPLTILVITSVALGAVATVLLGTSGWIRKARALRVQERKIDQLEAELAHRRGAEAAVAAARSPAAPTSPPSSPTPPSSPSTGG